MRASHIRPGIIEGRIALKKLVNFWVHDDIATQITCCYGLPVHSHLLNGRQGTRTVIQ